MSNSFLKNLYSLLPIALIVFMAIGIYQYFYADDEYKILYEDLLGKTQNYEQITKDLALLRVEYKEQGELLKSAKIDLEKVDLELSKNLKIVSNSDFILSSKTRRSKNADLIVGRDGKNKYLFHEVHFKDKDSIGPPIGYVMIYDDGRVVSKVYRHRINVSTFVSKNDDTGIYKVASKADFILDQSGLANRKDSKKKNWKNIPYSLNIIGGRAEINPVERIGIKKSFRFFDPHFDIGVISGVDFTGVGNISPNLGFSFASYGVSKRDNDFRFLRIGVGYSVINEAIDFNISPVMYNIGNSIKVLSNTYVYPVVFSNIYKNIGIGAGISASF